MTISANYSLTSSHYTLSFQTVPGSEVLVLWLESCKKERICLGYYSIATQLTLTAQAKSILSDMALMEVLALARGYQRYRQNRFANQLTLAKLDLQRA